MISWKEQGCGFYSGGPRGPFGEQQPPITRAARAARENETALCFGLELNQPIRARRTQQNCEKNQLS